MALKRFENGKAQIRAMLAQEGRAADPGNARADDDHIELFGLLRACCDILPIRHHLPLHSFGARPVPGLAAC